jgi:ribosomal protein S18 acetylase RimI-like enzyme
VNGGIRVRPAAASDTPVAAKLLLEPPAGLNAIFPPRVARRVSGAAFAARGTSFGYERSLMAEVEGEAVGLIARFPGAEWPRLRIRTGMVMLRAAGFRHGPALIRRGRVEDHLMPRVPSDVLFVSSLAVLPEHRSRGIGAGLLRHAVREAGEGRLRAVALDVAPENEAAVRFYVREGFVEVMRSERPASGRMPAIGFVRMERPASR